MILSVNKDEEQETKVINMDLNVYLRQACNNMIFL